MGNSSSSRTNDWESDEDGGSDYEHTYNYHTSVLHKSPADGFESDYDEDDDNDDDPGPAGGQSLRALPSRNATRETSNASSSASAVISGQDGGGDRKKEESAAEKTAGQTQNANDISQKAGCHRQTEDAHLNNRAVTTHTTNQAVHSTNRVAHSTQQTTQASDLTPGGRRVTSGASGPAADPGQSVGRQTRSSGQSAPRGDHRGARREGERMEEEEETYETAGEGSGEEVGSEGDSLSTITPPRTRPQSDSEYTVSEETPPNADSEEESEEGVEEDNDGDEWDRETERGGSCASGAGVVYQGHGSRLRGAACSDFAPAAQGSWESAHSRLPRRMEMSAESYRMARKRPPSPKPQRPCKRSRPLSGVSLSPNRTRYGVFDSESESDNATRGQQGRKRRAAPPSPLPPHPPPPRAQAESRSMSARSLRLVARRAASQFVETSRKILQDAKAAARILRESTGKRRSSGIVEEEEEDGPSRGKKPSPENGQRRNSPRVSRAGPSARTTPSAHSGEAVSVSSKGRRGAVKRRREEAPSPRSSSRRLRQRADTSSDTDSQTDPLPDTTAASREVRKDGGRLRKFTRNSATSATPSSCQARTRRQSPRLSPCVNNSHSLSLPVLPGAAGDSAPPSLYPPGQVVLNHSFPSALSANPFHNVTLRPSPSKRKWTDSVDSIGPELGGMGDWPSPFSALLKTTEGTGSPQTLTLSAGSVWARVTAHTNHATPPKGDQQGNNPASATPGPSGSRMATRTSPEVQGAGYPPNSTPRAPSLSLTGQFAHSGRFAFLLEKVLQVTVVVDSITMATTNGIVVSADRGLHHHSHAAHTVVQAAGSGLMQACRHFLKRKPQGLQVCEVLDTPAGGRLPPLISHVLHVVVPEGEGDGGRGVGEGGGQQRKLLLCTYLNCLKHAAQHLTLSSLALPLFGLETCPTEECVQVFFDSLLVFLAERLPDSPLHALQLFADTPALGRFIAEVLENRLLALQASSMDAAMAAVFRDYFNIPDFSRRCAVSDVAVAAASSSPLTLAGDRSPYGKPAVKRRRL